MKKKEFKKKVNLNFLMGIKHLVKNKKRKIRNNKS